MTAAVMTSLLALSFFMWTYVHGSGEIGCTGNVILREIDTFRTPIDVLDRDQKDVDLDFGLVLTQLKGVKDSIPSFITALKDTTSTLKNWSDPSGHELINFPTFRIEKMVAGRKSISEKCMAKGGILPSYETGYGMLKISALLSQYEIKQTFIESKMLTDGIYDPEGDDRIVTFGTEITKANFENKGYLVYSKEGNMISTLDTDEATIDAICMFPNFPLAISNDLKNGFLVVMKDALGSLDSLNAWLNDFGHIIDTLSPTETVLVADGTLQKIPIMIRVAQLISKFSFKSNLQFVQSSDIDELSTLPLYISEFLSLYELGPGRTVSFTIDKESKLLESLESLLATQLTELGNAKFTMLTKNQNIIQGNLMISAGGSLMTQIMAISPLVGTDNLVYYHNYIIKVGDVAYASKQSPTPTNCWSHAQRDKKTCVMDIPADLHQDDVDCAAALIHQPVKAQTACKRVPPPTPAWLTSNQCASNSSAKFLLNVAAKMAISLICNGKLVQTWSNVMPGIHPIPNIMCALLDAATNRIIKRQLIARAPVPTSPIALLNQMDTPKENIELPIQSLSQFEVIIINMACVLLGLVIMCLVLLVCNFCRCFRRQPQLPLNIEAEGGPDSDPQVQLPLVRYPENRPILRSQPQRPGLAIGSGANGQRQVAIANLRII